MLRILFRVITVWVGLLGFVTTGSACDKHKNPTAATEQPINVDQKTAFLNELPKESVKETKETNVAPVTNAENVKETTVIAPVANNDIQVIEFVLANKVEGREPKEIVEGFKQENGKGFAFAQLSAVKTSQVTFVWFREGKEHARFSTNVHASKRWRTFASTKLRAGNWKVQLIAGDQVLVERSFIVE